MTKTRLVLFGVALMAGCGDSASGEGGGGGGGAEATGVATGATTTAGPGTTVSSGGGTTTVATTASTTSGSTTGAGGGAERCADAVHCEGVQGYFCYEKTGPDPAFQDVCENELFGQFADGPCPDFYSDAACVYDCAEPSVFVFALSIDEAECEMNGGTYYEDP